MNISSVTHNARGATFIEFAIIFPVFLVLFTVVADGGIYLYKMLRLAYITHSVAREMATAVANRMIINNENTVDCSDALSYACDAVPTVYDANTNTLLRGVTFSVGSATQAPVRGNPWGGLPLMTVESTVNSFCIACFLIQSGFVARYQSTVTLETFANVSNDCSAAALRPCN